jgi:glycosyltransferase involved in cell wall biosynthesis
MKALYVTSMPPTESGIATYSSYLLAELVEKVELDVYDWKYPKNKIKRVFNGLIEGLKLAFKARNYRLVHIQYHIGEQTPIPLLLLGLLGTGCRKVLSLHEDDTEKNSLLEKTHYLLYRFMDALIVHTNIHRSHLPEKLQGRTHVIPHGVLEQERERTPEMGCILHPGFINPWKRQDLSVKIIKNLQARQMKLKLNIVGKGVDPDYVDKVKKQVADLRLADKVNLETKYLPEEKFMQYFKQAELAVLPYDRITMSGILAHIISWQIPVVASNLPAFKEVLGDAGVYFNVGDREDFAKKTLILLEDSKLREEKTRLMSKLKKEYGWETIASKTAELYSKVN